MTPEAPCPFCGKLIDAASDTVAGREPQEGDFSICFYCTGFMRFNADLTLCRATEADLDEMKRENPETFRTLVAARVVIIEHHLNSGQSLALVNIEQGAVVAVLEGKKPS